MFKKFIFLAFSCLILFIVIEVCLRVYLWHKTGNIGYLQYAVKNTKSISEKLMPKEYKIESKKDCYPGYYKLTKGKYEMLNGSHYSYTINSLGFRGLEFSARKSKDIIRITALGCSGTFGLGVQDCETYPCYLQKTLGSSGKKRFEVINCGFPSAMMTNILHLFKSEVINYQPDIIVISEAINDAIFEVPVLKNFWYSVHRQLYYRSMLYTLLLEKYSLLKRSDATPFFFSYNKSIPHGYIDNLRKIIELAKEKNIKLILVSEPMLTNVNFPNDLLGLESMYKNSPDTAIRYLIKQRYYNKQMEQIANEYNIIFVDAAKFIEKKQHLFLDANHLNAEGNRLFAELVDRAILKER